MTNDQIEQSTIWEPNSGCLIWLAGLNQSGYGQVRHGGRNHLAHRLIYRLQGNLIPDGMCLLHRCDNRTCCNPNHLFLGTRADNQRDMKAKGRGRGKISRGEQHGFSKLTTADVIAIRASKENQAVIAAQFGISQTNVSSIRLRKTWGHVQ